MGKTGPSDSCFACQRLVREGDTDIVIDMANWFFTVATAERYRSTVYYLFILPINTVYKKVFVGKAKVNICIINAVAYGLVDHMVEKTHLAIWR